MRNGFGWWRLAKQVVLGTAEAVASFANSTFTAASATGTADGSTANTLTLTLRDTNNVLMGSKAVTFTTELTAVDAAETTLVDDAAEIAATTGTLNLVLVCKNADGVPLPNIASARIVFASTGSNNTFGTPSVTDKNGQSLCTFSSTTAEAKTISVTVDEVAVTQTAAVTVTGGAPALLTPVFQSDWATATGGGSSARSDGGVWNVFTGQADKTVVVASTGLDFPTTNVLRVQYIDTIGGSEVLRATGLGVPADGDTRWYRWYHRVVIADGVSVSDPEVHHIQDGASAGSSNWMFKIYHDGVSSKGTAADKWVPHFHVQSTTSPGPSNNRFDGPALDKDTTYRFAFGVTITSATTFTCQARVYDSSGTLLHTETAFTDTSNPTIDLGEVTVTANNMSYFDGINAGGNGLGGTDWNATDPIFDYQGGIAVCDNQGIPGAWGTVTGES